MWHRQYSTKYSPTFNMIVGEYSVKYCRSHKTLLWIWIMLCFVPFLRRQCHSKPLSIIIFLDLLFQEIKYTLVHCVCHMIRHSSMSQSYSSIEKIMYLTHNLIPWTVIIYKTFFHVMLKLVFFFLFSFPWGRWQDVGVLMPWMWNAYAIVKTSSNQRRSS